MPVFRHWRQKETSPFLESSTIEFEGGLFGELSKDKDTDDLNDLNVSNSFLEFVEVALLDCYSNIIIQEQT